MRHIVHRIVMGCCQNSKWQKKNLEKIKGKDCLWRSNTRWL